MIAWLFLLGRTLLLDQYYCSLVPVDITIYGLFMILYANSKAAVDMAPLLTQVKNCQLCASSLVDGVRPVVQIDPQAKILIIGQALDVKCISQVFCLMMPVATDYDNG
jgi:hypothetical protein